MRPFSTHKSPVTDAQARALRVRVLSFLWRQRDRRHRITEQQLLQGYSGTVWHCPAITAIENHDQNT